MKFIAYPNPERLEFPEKTMWRQSLSTVIDGVPARIYRYTSDLEKCLPSGEYTLTTSIQVRNDKLVMRPEYIPVQAK